ncbi:hypothetical protein [Vibrio alginolyticus]|uniref:hypothetical protein n=1 Tax=Vibrio alginolyticus TaxID=663 RepID=UPI00211A548E|nr:hypothetical protein [Vibrio alginolyticus]
MARERAFSDQQVVEAANALLVEGKNINGTSLRNKIGTGRPSALMASNTLLLIVAYEKIKSGQRRAQFIHSRHLGRPAKESNMLLNDYPDVVSAYDRGLSLRKASTETGRAINTVRKVCEAVKVRNKKPVTRTG